MTSYLPLDGRNYYDSLPPLGHSPGDIWSGFPDFGLFGSQNIRAIVITPACDLANRKVETVTFLPIIPVLAYFGTITFIPEALRTLTKNMDLANCPIQLPSNSTSAYELPEEALINKIKSWIHIQLNENNDIAKKNHGVYLGKLHAAIKLVEHCADPKICEVSSETLREFLGEKEFSSRLKRICRNAGPTDIHFLPFDGQSPDYSAVPKHSLVLFRYALTIPVSILDTAQQAFSEEEWRKLVNKQLSTVPSIKFTANERPLRLARLRDIYWSDLLTRYLAMHIRLGSPDFSANRIDSFIADICS